MPEDKMDSQIPIDEEANADESKVALLRQIPQEMDTMTLEELARLYAAVTLLKDENREALQSALAVGEKSGELNGLMLKSFWRVCRIGTSKLSCLPT